MQSFVFFIFLLYYLISHAIECPSGYYKVQGHPRSGYVRSDGTAVRPTTVNSYCKELTYANNYSQNRFKKGTPKNWPHRVEKPGAWIESEKRTDNRSS